MVLVGGEISTQAWVDIEAIARTVIKDIDMCSSEMGFDWESCAVLSAIGKQSSDIARGVDKAEQGAGDQGSCLVTLPTETDVFVPAPITYAHRLMKTPADLRKNGILPWLTGRQSQSHDALCR